MSEATCKPPRAIVRVGTMGHKPRRWSKRLSESIASAAGIGPDSNKDAIGKFVCALPTWAPSLVQSITYRLALEADGAVDSWAVAIEPVAEPFSLLLEKDGVALFHAWYTIKTTWQQGGWSHSTRDEYDLYDRGTWRAAWDPFGLFGRQLVLEWDGIPRGRGMTVECRGEGPFSPAAPIQPPLSVQLDGNGSLISEHGTYAREREDAALTLRPCATHDETLHRRAALDECSES